MPDRVDSDRDQRPRVVSVAFGFFLAAAAINAAIGVFFASQAVRGTVTNAQGRDVPLSGAGATTVAALALIALLYAAGVVVLAVLLRRGRTWARSTLFALTLLSLLPPIVSITIPVLVVVLLLAVGDILMYRPAVTRWHRRLRGLPPG